ncbi:MAG: hypothetical protein DRJ01_14960, partial [Bacteroidetes bacterium]
MKHFKLLLTLFAVFSITLSFSQSQPIEYKNISPVQKKMYNHFMTDKWTYDSMAALKGKALFTELSTFLTKENLKEGY